MKALNTLLNILFSPIKFISYLVGIFALWLFLTGAFILYHVFKVIRFRFGRKHNISQNISNSQIEELRQEIKSITQKRGDNKEMIDLVVSTMKKVGKALREIAEKHEEKYAEKSNEGQTSTEEKPNLEAAS